MTDSKRAFGLAAAYWRSRFSLPVIAVAGSNGKTTVTQMVAAILGAAYGFVWVALLGYVLTIARRLQKVESELADLESRSK